MNLMQVKQVRYPSAFELARTVRESLEKVDLLQCQEEESEPSLESGHSCLYS